MTVYHITLIHMVITRLSRATPARRKLSGQCDGQCRRGVRARARGSREGKQRHRGGCGGYRCGHRRKRGSRRGFDGANAILNSPPGDVPVIDNVRPLDRKPFARSVTKFMKVSSALAAHNCRRETERKRGRPVRETCARCPVRAYAHRREHVPLVSALKLWRGCLIRLGGGIFPARRIFDFRIALVRPPR